MSGNARLVPLWVLGVLMGLLATVGGPALRADAATGNILAPFTQGETWRVYQGYASGTHTGTSLYGLDLTVSTSTTATAGRTVRAPMAGTIYYWDDPYGNLCVNTANGRSYTLTHINPAKTSGTVAAGEALGTVAAAGQRNNNNVAHLHFEFWSGPGCYDRSTPLAFSAANGIRICGAPDLPASGPDGGNGIWSGTTFTAQACGSTGVSPQGVFDSAAMGARGQVRVRGWAFDKDQQSSPVTVQVTIGGPKGTGELHTLTANTSRPDVGTAYPGVGNSHGFDAAITTAKFGPQTVYVYAVNRSGTGGSDKLLGTKSLYVVPPLYAGTRWERVGTTKLSKVDFSPTGMLWGVTPRGKAVQYLGAGQWTKRGSGFVDITVGIPSDVATGGPQVYAVRKDGSLQRWRTDHWENVGETKVSSVDFGATGGLWAVTPRGNALQYAGGGTWTKRGSGFVDITVGIPSDVATGGPQVYAVRKDGSLQRWRMDHWENVAGKAAAVDFGPDGSLWAVAPGGKIKQYVGGGNWTKRGDGFSAVTVGMPSDGLNAPRVYAVRANGTIARWR